MKQLPWIPQRGRTSWAGKGGYVSFASVSVDFGLDIGMDMESVNFLNGSDPDMCAVRLVAKTAKAMMSMVKIQKLPLRFRGPAQNLQV